MTYRPNLTSLLSAKLLQRLNALCRSQLNKNMLQAKFNFLFVLIFFFPLSDHLITLHLILAAKVIHAATLPVGTISNATGQLADHVIMTSLAAERTAASVRHAAGSPSTWGGGLPEESVDCQTITKPAFIGQISLNIFNENIHLQAIVTGAWFTCSWRVFVHNCHVVSDVASAAGFDDPYAFCSPPLHDNHKSIL
jgi:hypothetical protein